MSSMDEQEREKYDPVLRSKALMCLQVFGGIYNRRMYIPGDTKDLDMARKVMIENGGLISLLFLSKRDEIDLEWRRDIEDFLD